MALTNGRLCLAIVVAGVCAGQGIELANGRIRAQFNDRGLASISDGRLGVDTFSSDAFWVVIDGRRIESSGLPKPTIARAGSTVTYTYAVDGLTFDAVYEIRPAWDFVSKQLRIQSRSGSTFRVNKIAPFRSALELPIRDQYVPSHESTKLGTADYGGFLRFEGGRGLLALVQNPFLRFVRNDRSFEISYEPEIDWNPAWGPFASDRGILAPYASSGRFLPAQMIPEWKLATADSRQGMNSSEVATYQNVVRAFVQDQAPRPVDVFVGWCVNDYQIDISTPEGRVEYKRIIDRAAEMGAKHVLFAPSNTAISLRALSADDWSWENLLWLGLGQKIRKGEWKIESDPVPASVAEMLDYARSKKVGLLAYVYPVLGFLADRHPEWLVPGAKPERANLGIRSYQDWLIDALANFARRTGISGYSFDHTFLNFAGASPYAQWRGWTRVMEELRRRMPDVVIDGRQAYHLYGPWGWLAGTYPHPTYNDEQPESFVPFPDLHFDRVSANRERYTAWRYRNVEFAPSELVPGFITHQTPRLDDKGELPVKIIRDARTGLDEQLPVRFRARDWDYLGWRFSLLSSIALAGLNNVLNMIPARDLDEFRNFSDGDRAEFRKWIDWTASNREFLRHTRTIIGQPALGKVDGTSAINGDRGYIFLFNPNGSRLNAEFPLDASIGLTSGSRFVLRELAPLEGRLIGKPGAGFWSPGDRVSLNLDGTSATVIQVSPVAGDPSAPTLFGAPGEAALVGGVLQLSGVRGEVGTVQELLVYVPSARDVKSSVVNGSPVPFENAQRGLIRIQARFAGAPFRRSQKVDISDRGEGVLTGRFSVPHRISDQLSERRKRWPIPWTPEDYRTTWLAPERLLLFVQMADPDDGMNISMRLDGRDYPLQKAYSSVRPHARSFVGFYADVSAFQPDHEYKFELKVPASAPGRLQGVFFDNVETEYTDVIAR